MASKAGDTGSVPGSGRSPRGGNGNLVQYCLENHMDREAWWTTVLGVTKSGHDWAHTRTHDKD